MKPDEIGKFGSSGRLSVTIGLLSLRINLTRNSEELYVII
jgi:hypothetical protein